MTCLRILLFRWLWHVYNCMPRWLFKLPELWSQQEVHSRQALHLHLAHPILPLKSPTSMGIKDASGYCEWLLAQHINCKSWFLPLLIYLIFFFHSSFSLRDLYILGFYIGTALKFIFWFKNIWNLKLIYSYSFPINFEVLVSFHQF